MILAGECDCDLRDRQWSGYGKCLTCCRSYRPTASWSRTFTLEPDRRARLPVAVGYETLASVLDEALMQAQAGKGKERHASGDAYEDQQIVQLGEWMGGSTAFAVGQACKKSIESTRLPHGHARAELLGAINYLAAAVIVLDRKERDR